jgi:hypothetical protein
MDTSNHGVNCAALNDIYIYIYQWDIKTSGCQSNSWDWKRYEFCGVHIFNPQIRENHEGGFELGPHLPFLLNAESPSHVFTVDSLCPNSIN